MACLFLVCGVSCVLCGRIVRLGGRRVKHAVGGAWHTVIRTDTGESYVMGCVWVNREYRILVHRSEYTGVSGRVLLMEWGAISWSAAICCVEVCFMVVFGVFSCWRRQRLLFSRRFVSAWFCFFVWFPKNNKIVESTIRRCIL